MHLAAPVLLARLFDKMSLCLFFSCPCPALLGERIEALVWGFAVIDRLITFFTLDAQLWDPLCEAEEAFLSFLSFKCQLASEWPTGLPSSTLHNLLSVCKVLRGFCGDLSDSDKSPEWCCYCFFVFFSVFYQICFFVFVSCLFCWQKIILHEVKTFNSNYTC